MKTVAIIGVGLMGGSFGLALRKAGFDGEILGVCEPACARTAIAHGAITAAVPLIEAAERGDLIYLADRVDVILKVLEVIGPIARTESLVTDCGSTKSVIVGKAQEFVLSAAFVGGHPMAGKEQRGVENADPDLFRGRPYILTESSRHSPFEDEFRNWLSRIGARVMEMSPAEHDAAVAYTSHLPQLLSTALATTLSQQDQESFHAVFGPGLIDMTRLALSGPELWQSILATNQDRVAEAIDAFIDTLVSVKQNLRSEKLVGVFREAVLYSQQLRRNSM